MPVEYDVFVSHAWAQDDLERSRQLSTYLRKAGLRVWFDEERIQDFESITKAIQHGLSRSKVLLAWYSEIYPLRRGCQWELTSAYIAAEREGRLSERILVVNPETNERSEPVIAHIVPETLRASKVYAAPRAGDTAGMKRLAKSVTQHVAGIDRAFENSHAQCAPAWYGMTGIGSTRFVGRLPEMWQIHSLLHGEKMSMIAGSESARSGAVQLRGLGGVGKSLLAEEYALRFGSAYPGGIFWLCAFGNDYSKKHYEDARTIENRESERQIQIGHFATRLGISTQGLGSVEIEAALAREINKRGEPCLWVADDVPAGLGGLDLRRWLAPHPLARTLVTTRTRDYDGQIPSIDIGPLPPEDAYRLISSRRTPTSDAESEQAVLLTKDLGCHALALDVTAVALSSFGANLPFTQFRAEIARPDTDALSLASSMAGILPNGHEPSIARTLRRSILGLPAEARDFLRLAALLAVAPIPARLVAKVFEKTHSLGQSQAAWRQAAAFNGVTAACLADVTGEARDARLVHQLVSRVVRFLHFDSAGDEMLRNAIVEVLTEEMGQATDDFKMWKKFEILLAHSTAIASPPSSIAEAKLLLRLSEIELEQGRLASAKSHAQQVESFPGVSSVPLLPEIVGLLIFRIERFGASFLVDACDPTKRIHALIGNLQNDSPLFLEAQLEEIITRVYLQIGASKEQALSFTEVLSGLDAIHRHATDLRLPALQFRTILTQARILSRLCKWDRAHFCLKEAKRIGKTSPSKRAEVLFVEGRIFSAQARQAEDAFSAKRDHDVALRRFRQALKLNHPAIAFQISCELHIAELLLVKGQVVEAERALNRISERIQGTEHSFLQHRLSALRRRINAPQPMNA